jgi:putative nucleotidyltransferase with HDIG domain
MKILIVDDNADDRRLLRCIIEKKGHECIEAEDGLEGLRMAKIHRPDLIISDALMPLMDGFQFLRMIKEDEALKSTLFIFYSAVYKADKDVDLAIALGAEGYIIKPREPSELWEEVEFILDEAGKKKTITPELIREDEEYLKRYSQVVVAKLEEKVRELEDALGMRKRAEDELKKAYDDLEQLFVNTIRTLASVIDAKSPWTKGHSERVTNYALVIGKEMGLPEKDLENLKLSGLLHDIGKVGTYDLILDKAGKLTDDEFEHVKMHPEKGAEILKPISQLRDVIPIILYHHERYRGEGYPASIEGEDIPLCARILCVADSFDSMTAERPYRPTPGREYAISELKRCSGTQFDPKVVEAFLKALCEK